MRKLEQLLRITLTQAAATAPIIGGLSRALLQQNVVMELTLSW
jgi:hypothetical protein